eukprot:s553_g18.t1
MILLRQVLPRFGYRQKVPVRCTVCKSKKQPLGKVVDAVKLRAKDFKHFLSQHCKTDLHLKMMAKIRQESMREEIPDPDPVRCEAFVLREEEEEDTKLSVLRKNLLEWISWQGDCELRRHSYSFKTDSRGKIFTIRHEDCQQQVVVKCPEDVPICKECQKIGDQKGIIRTVLKHVRKKFAAELLHAKLFVSDEKVEQMKDDMKKDPVYKPHSQFFDLIMNFRTHELQTWVRKSFLCVPGRIKSDQYQSFMDTTVDPCMRMNVHAALQSRPQIVQAQTLFTNFLEQGDPAIVDRINVEIAQASLSGKLQNHPLLQGLILSCLKMLDRQERGLQMTGRDDEGSLQFTDEVRYLVQEAGCQLAILGCNKHILQKFGLRQRPKVPDLTDSGLPTPMIALQSAEMVRENMLLIDQRLSAATETSGCDSLTFLAWDPSAENQLCLSAAEIPVSCADVDTTFMTQTVDRFMASGAADYVKILCFDAHGSHSVIKRVMFGMGTDRDMQLLFEECCRRAYDAALTLASWAGNFTTESLKTYYEESCAAGWFDQSHSHAPEFDVEEESDDEAAKAREMFLARSDSDRYAHVLRSLGQLAAAEPDLDQQDLRAEDDPLQDVNLSRVDEEDKSELLQVLEADDEEEKASAPDDREKVPRCAQFGGCDTLWIKTRAPRKRELNWFQKNNQILAIHQRKAVESRDRVRAGRLERWIHQGQKLRDSMSAQVAEPEAIRTGNVVLFVDKNKQISIGLVLVVWRIGKKRKPAANPCPVQSCYCFRVVSESIAAWKETHEKTAEDWECSFVAQDSTGEKRKKTRRARIFQRARRVSHKAAKSAKLDRKDRMKKGAEKGKKTEKKKKTATLQKVKESKKIEVTEENFGRSEKGRKLVKQEMATLLTLDLEKFPAKPAFEAGGACRLKIPAAAGKTWDMIMEIAPIYFETLFISTRSRTEYGRAVFKHFDVIKKQMGREERSGWLRLLRTLCEMPRPSPASKDKMELIRRSWRGREGTRTSDLAHKLNDAIPKKSKGGRKTLGPLHDEF